MGNPDLIRQKLDQAVDLLGQYDIDLWLSFARESGVHGEPALALIYPLDITWQSAFLIGRGGERLAIVGRYDAAAVRALSVFSEVVGYDQSLRPALVEALRRLRPGRVALNFSRSDPAADGLTVGMKLMLDEMLAEAGVGPDQVISSESFLSSLRGRKTPGEVEAIRRAVSRSDALLDEVGGRIRPDVTERQLAEFLHQRMRQEQLAPAWALEGNPIVTTGPSQEAPGHAGPTDRPVQAGHLVHFDFGVKLDDYCADLQRMWYVLKPGERQPPDEVQRVWAGVRGALLAGAAALQPGRRGWEVDLAARRALTDRGLPEYLHAFGHHLGRAAHDGSTILGPRWERYGETPNGRVEAGNVFAIELGAPVPGIGWIYLEEDVFVGSSGVEWLSTPQTELRLLQP